MKTKKRTMKMAGVLSTAAMLLTVAVSVGGGASAAELDARIITFVQAEQVEYRFKDGKDSLNWDAQGWVGEDYNKLWIKAEGEKTFGGGVEEAEFQLLYSRIIHPFWDIQVGGRFDVRPRPQRGYGVLAIQGLAPQFFDVDAAAFVSNKGDVSARLMGEYDLLLTQKLILQPSVELNLAAQQVKELGIGSGLTDVEIGLRLRYEVVREFAPYVGVSWERKVGKTADFAREEGEDVDSLSLVAGIRFWL